MQVQGYPAAAGAWPGGARAARAAGGLSQEALALRSQLHRNHVGAMERGEINPTLRTLLRLTAGLVLPLSELVVVYERQMTDGTQGR